jgi:hypothetical protein
VKRLSGKIRFDRTINEQDMLTQKPGWD